MSDIFEIPQGDKKHQIARQACRVAYTINNKQPVASTIIGEQPLFYMDYESDYIEEEAGIFEDADFSLLENELRELKKEIDSFDKFSESFGTEEEKIARFFDDKDSICEKSKSN